ncbi:hypothetical protein [Limnohabitans parvus]|uniref:Uncharacterized protein n=1 Tax=Limnohabitans parvus II-B4 TaxID=1293052 RepID=A0A315EF23_9BURK|nr:hypothetical protein [Limnohabitans parvus]PUE55205.1 hypothetical protein B9Z37_01020 [Limnohabitans parvus II-B4]
MNEEIKKKIFEDLFLKLFERGLQGVDRTPTVRLPFDDFEEYYDTIKNLQFAPYSTLDKLLFKIVKMYFEAQMRPLCEDLRKRSEIIYNLTKDSEIELVAIFKNKWPKICQDIEAKRNSTPQELLDLQALFVNPQEFLSKK